MTVYLQRAVPLAWLRIVLASVALFAGVTEALAQSYPSRLVRLIVPYPVGGSADLVTRIVADKLSSSWAPVIVESKPGANGNIASDYVSRLPGDGYTFLVASGFLTVNPLLRPELKWTHKTFVPVALMGGGPPNVFVTPAAAPFATLQEVVRNAKAKPRQLNVGTPSLGSSNHFGLELFYSTAGIEVFPIVYTGTPPVVPALVRGDVDLSLLPVTLVAPQVRGERMKALAISSTKRSSLMPELPTVAEAGFAEAVLLPWFGLVAPPGTPRTVVDAVNAEVRKALASKDVIERMEKIGAEILGGTADDFQRHIDREAEVMGRLIKERNIRIQ